VRAQSGEMKLSESEIEQFAGHTVDMPSSQESTTLVPDERLGIKRAFGGLKANGERRGYKVAGYEREINGYRTAFSAIAGQVEYIKELNQQLRRANQMPESCDFEINTPQVGHWKVCSALLNLKRGDILLCRRGDEFAVVEHVPDDSA